MTIEELEEKASEAKRVYDAAASKTRGLYSDVCFARRENYTEATYWKLRRMWEEALEEKREALKAKHKAQRKLREARREQNEDFIARKRRELGLPPRPKAHA